VLGFDVGGPSQDASTEIPAAQPGRHKSAAWVHAVRDHTSEQRFRMYLRVSRSTFSKLEDVLWAHARASFRRRRGGGQLALDLQLALTVYQLGHYGNACSADAVADLFGVSVAAVIKSTRRVVKALSMIAPEHVKWPSRSCGAASSRFSADGYGLKGCIGATDGTAFPLAYQPALHSWSYVQRTRLYLSGKAQLQLPTSSFAG